MDTTRSQNRICLQPSLRGSKHSECHTHAIPAQKKFHGRLPNPGRQLTPICRLRYRAVALKDAPTGSLEMRTEPHANASKRTFATTRPRPSLAKKTEPQESESRTRNRSKPIDACAHYATRSRIRSRARTRTQESSMHAGTLSVRTREIGSRSRQKRVPERSGVREAASGPQGRRGPFRAVGARSPCATLHEKIALKSASCCNRRR